MHLFSGDSVPATLSNVERVAASASNPESERIQILEQQVSQLKSELLALREQFADFQKQFQ
jgi:uncharacterized protein YceH (UPF0502 family)